MSRNWVALLGVVLVGCPSGGTNGDDSALAGMVEKGGAWAPGAYTATGSGGHPNSCPDT